MASSLRVVRRPKGSAPRRRALTAASAPITDPQKQLKSTLVGAGRNNWQQEAWELSEEIGELGYYVSWRANSCSRAPLIASEIDPDTGLPTGGLPETDSGELTPEAKRVAEYVRAIADGALGQAALVKRAVECLTIVGEVYIAVLVRAINDPLTGEARAVVKWYAVTSDEITRKTGEQAEIELPDGTKHDYNKSLDSLIRIWVPRPRKAREATSPVRACLEPLREIKRTSAKIKHAAKSRMMNNGVLLLPEEMSLPAAEQPIPEGLADVPGLELPVVSGVPAADQLATQLYQASVASMEDEDAQTSFIPQLVTAKGEHIKDVKHITFASDVTEVEIKTRTDAIVRLAMGLDVSPERLLGMSKGNHWSAWEIADQDVQLHIKPVMDLFCQALYNDLLAGLLRKDGIDPTKYILWYDASNLTADPDLTDEAIQAHDRGAITSEALRRLLNVGEDAGYDLTTIEGCQVFAQDVVTKNPELIRTFAPLLGPEIAELDFPEPPAIGQGRAQPGEGQDDEGDGEEEPDTEDDADSSASAATSARAEFLVAHRMGVARALDLAGKRRLKVNDRDQKARLRGLAPHDYHRVMGPVRAAEVPKLIEGWDAGLEADVMARLGVDTDELRAAVRREIVAQLTRPIIDVEAG
ncbi:portal protein [Mycobacterium phage BirdsNest]|uniref:Portal protein n=1 Tax=Mycobacterium phage BirdsNest TaxID=2686231 RepID=A0A6B9LHL5_9CAUD|nr:portal protein [Mycobacterium phage BirdsNest]QHB37314.1 portal protein [Mycobacterium phage BirdsNest]